MLVSCEGVCLVLILMIVWRRTMNGMMIQFLQQVRKHVCN